MQNDNFPLRPINELIVKVLQKEATDEEIELLEQWLKKDEDHRRQFDEINATFQTAVSLGRFTPQKIDAAWDKFSQRINQPGVKQRRLRHTAFSPLRIAASLLIIAAAGILVWQYSARQTDLSDRHHTLVQNDVSNKTRLVLPDSSVVWLNANSSLTYDAGFGRESRDVTLKGEAFFDVRKGRQDFIVKTDNLSIRVKGTKFNVNAFGSGDSERATLAEGRIELQVKGTTRVFDMKPGDQVSYHRTSQSIVREKVNPSHFSAWKEETLTFDNTPLTDIVQSLRNRYQVAIEIDSALAQREKLSMTIGEESIHEVLELIRLSSSLRYQVAKDTIRIYE